MVAAPIQALCERFNPHEDASVVRPQRDRRDRSLLAGICGDPPRSLCLGIELAVGMELTLYTEDQALDGAAELLLVDAVVEDYDGQLVAHVDPSSWRHVPAEPG